ncbi:hypothetical protein [Hippea maritima]|uniref:Uncharacterized protein n=1 Tax=Hippea maritima (strain ATCC 700847 / DSM 10411 / MH2) TaxID=760142 RepID=F2LWL3_HIPMA|nr:hypothetical protein [Hippea maritima]AEA34122.1 hypothetical protein Hipma_1160 [Hippea maritima DSM 10411]
MYLKAKEAIAGFSIFFLTVVVLSFPANAASTNSNSKRFQTYKERVLKKTDLKIEKTEKYLKRLEGYKTCVEKSNDFQELKACKIKYGFYRYRKHKPTNK